MPVWVGSDGAAKIGCGCGLGDVGGLKFGWLVLGATDGVVIALV